MSCKHFHVCISNQIFSYLIDMLCLCKKYSNLNIHKKSYHLSLFLHLQKNKFERLPQGSRQERDKKKRTKDKKNVEW